jgi:hypothetical protein
MLRFTQQASQRFTLAERTHSGKIINGWADNLLGYSQNIVSRNSFIDF